MDGQHQVVVRWPPVSHDVLDTVVLIQQPGHLLLELGGAEVGHVSAEPGQVELD